jgi:hypothetical protein
VAAGEESFVPSAPSGHPPGAQERSGTSIHRINPGVAVVSRQRLMENTAAMARRQLLADALLAFSSVTTLPPVQRATSSPGSTPVLRRSINTYFFG